jgi:hypothetical protein
MHKALIAILVSLSAAATVTSAVGEVRVLDAQWDLGYCQAGKNVYVTVYIADWHEIESA